ncbi:unnamed protein product, partial [Mesorhabditis belari]|uniref:G protein-coupled receptor n=1 Tax=Mesorhabditis belari TaxID=2138241 RepID=A0AAF3F3A0_9BILA
MALYILLITKILLNRRRIKVFASAFFDLIITEFINDLIYWIFIQFGLRFPRYYILPFTSSAIGTMCYGMMLTFRGVLYLGHIPFALNRLILYISPVMYRSMWTRKTVLLCFAIQWFIALSVNIPFFLTVGGATMKVMPTTMLMAGNTAAVQMNTIQALTIIPISTVICSISFGISLKISAQVKSVSKLERRLLICSILQAIPMLLELGRSTTQFLLVSVLNNQAAYSSTAETLYYYMDITCTIQPWCLLATNSNIRRLLFSTKSQQIETVMESQFWR